jgi:hypothetical protein
VSRRLLPLVAGALAAGLLAYNTATRPHARLTELRYPQRYWEDVAIATSHYLNRGRPEVEEATTGSSPGATLRVAYQRHLTRGVEEHGIRSWQFWRVVPLRPFLRRERIRARPYDDAGRSTLMALGFRGLGGVSPYLGLWLGAVGALPLLLWLACELAASGRPVAAVLLPSALASSAFLVELLALPYSAAGFYALAVIALGALAVHALLVPPGSPRRLALRVLLAGGCFAVCLACRASTRGLLPAFLLAVVLAAVRQARAEAAATGWRRVAAGALLGAGLFLAPHAATTAVRSGHGHALWGDMWEGLGDFDREKGHEWSDPELRRLLRREGMRVNRHSGAEWESDQSEALLRRLVLRDIREDPAWYATILAKRLGATLSQWRLWPYGPEDGRSVLGLLHPAEGLIVTYYGMTATVDFLAFGPSRLELRVAWLIAPSLLLAGLALSARRVRRLAPHASTLWGSLAVLGILATGTLVLPVGVTTASALETESFALVYFFGFALCADALARVAAADSAGAQTARPRAGHPRC